VDFLSGDRAFALETLRIAGFAGDGGADVGEVFATAARIPDGDEEAWSSAWRETAVRSARRGEASLDAGDVVGAREAFLRASNYYRAAERFISNHHSKVLEALGLSRCSRHYFSRAAAMLDVPFAEVVIPYEGGELPGHLFLADDTGTPRPTVIYTGGFASSREEGYFVIGAAALRRGYHFLAYDGPGQGATLREKALPMRPDWEHVLGAVVDYALTVPEIDGANLVQFGHGLGSYLVARHAAHDHRSAAIVCNDAMTTFYAVDPAIPEPVLELIEDGRDDDAIPMLDVLMKDDTHTRWALEHGRWAFGAATTADYVRRTAEYSVTTKDVRAIRTPALILEGEADTALAGQASNLAVAMTAPVHHVVMHDEGASYCLHETVFDHLADALH
jgi:pimeloyl-ACP methyl ester carboxylesterase